MVDGWEGGREGGCESEQGDEKCIHNLSLSLSLSQAQVTFGGVATGGAVSGSVDYEDDVDVEDNTLEEAG